MAEARAAPTSANGATDPVVEARERMLATVEPVGELETVSLHAGRRRVLAAEVRAMSSSPPADNSAMDGYALRVTDLSAAEGILPVRQRIAAGSAPEPLAVGAAARIFTGGVIPAGADAVVMQERCREADGLVTVSGSVQPGDNIRRAGEDLRQGNRVLAPGEFLRPQELGLAASAGHGFLQVFRRVRVAVLVTGDELVSAGQPLEPGRIHNSNGPLLAGMLEEINAEITRVHRIGDRRVSTREALAASAAEADLVITTGGVSVGEEDHVRAAVGDLGRITVHQVALKPGKPVAFGRIGRTPFLGLPGNPVSLFVTFALFGAPLLRRLQGRRVTCPEALRLAAGFARQGGKRDEYIRVRREGSQLHEFAHQGSGILGSVHWATGLARIPAGAAVSSGAGLDYLAFTELLA